VCINWSKKIIQKRIEARAQELASICEEQGGFREGRGTIESFFILHETIAEAFEEAKPLFVAFLDIRKAYDTVYIEGLFVKLAKIIGNGRMWRFLLDIYENSSTKVKIGDLETNFFTLIEGILQGSVLGPLLFLIFIDDLAQEVKETGNGACLGQLI